MYMSTCHGLCSGQHTLVALFLELGVQVEEVETSSVCHCLDGQINNWKILFTGKPDDLFSFLFCVFPHVWRITS